MTMRVNIIMQAYLSLLPHYLTHEIFAPNAYAGARVPFFECRISQEASSAQTMEFKMKVRSFVFLPPSLPPSLSPLSSLFVYLTFPSLPPFLPASLPPFLNRWKARRRALPLLKSVASPSGPLRLSEARFCCSKRSTDGSKRMEG